MFKFFRVCSLTLMLGITTDLAAIALTTLVTTTITTTVTTIGAQAQPLKKSQKLAYKQVFDQRTRFADKHCVFHQKTVNGLKHDICRMEDLVMKVSLEGPPGDNGPVAYFYGGRLYAFRDTGNGQAWIFEKGRLVAEVEVGIEPSQSKVRTIFNQQERQSVTDRAITSTRNMLKVFGEELRL
ncbi:hypothetical protein [Alkalinema sp. FACHB-956]|uniref:hypothetical protein n=1 Tax=Alkalinema sp. FACHB-956 TaxID=2692768 RepID=UPI0016862DF6|nr:hypothetical protein [Alkalinema sp. FACHB-956]MBD2326056.1 hypothetical protein [Alkalinema sp. FACHB-956]